MLHPRVSFPAASPAHGGDTLSCGQHPITSWPGGARELGLVGRLCQGCDKGLADRSPPQTHRREAVRGAFAALRVFVMPGGEAENPQWGEAVSWQEVGERWWRDVAPEGCKKEHGPPRCCASLWETAQVRALRGARGAEICLPPSAWPEIGAVGSACRDAAPGVPS